MKNGWLLLLLCLLIVPASTALAQTDSLVLTNPVGGEILYTNRDSSLQIQWSGIADTVLVRIEWTNDGRKWNVIADSVKGGTYRWVFGSIPISSTYRIRVLQARPPIGSDNVTYTGHLGVVMDGAWSPQADRVVSVSASADIWDAETGGPLPLLTLNTQRAKLLGVRWTADSSLIWLYDQGTNGLMAFQTSTNASVYQYQCNCDVFAAHVGASGRRVVVAGPRNVHVVDYLNPTPIRQILSNSDVLQVALDSTETKVLVCNDQASVYPVAGGLPVVFRKHIGGVLAGAFQPYGQMVATVGGDATLRVWNVATAVEVWNGQASPEGMRSVAFSPDGTLIAVGMSDSSVTIWDATSGQMLHRVSGISGAVRDLEWAPLGDALVTAGDDNVAHVISVADGKVITRLSHQNSVTAAHWGQDGGSLLTTSLDGTARIWRIREVVLQADTSGQFSYAPPPPAFARFHTTGGQVEIGNDITLTLNLEAADKLSLADVDSVQFQLTYDASILYPTTVSVPVKDQRDSAFHRIITLAAVPLPVNDASLASFTFRATLGADSITALNFRSVTQIGRGSNIRIETVADTVLVRGICRQSGSPRLYSPIGIPLNAVARWEGGLGTLDVTVGETGPVTICAFDVSGRTVWSTTFTRKQGDTFDYRFPLDGLPLGRMCLFSVSTLTQQVTALWENVR